MSDTRKQKLILNVNDNNKNQQCIITSKNKNVYCDDEAKQYYTQNDFLSKKKIITVSPGGFKGFYLLGILTYLKEKYNTDNYIFSGASAGAWNSLFMCYKNEPLKFVYDLLNHVNEAKSLTDVQYFIKYKLLTNYKDEDFDLKKLFIGVTTFNNFKIRTNIFSDFDSLDDAINCCMASSHIPLITGGFTNRYHNMYAFDGGFSDYPYLNIEESTLHVYPDMWDKINNENKKPKPIKSSVKSLLKYSDFFSLSKNNPLQLFDEGYNDAKQNKDYFNKLFCDNEFILSNK